MSLLSCKKDKISKVEEQFDSSNATLLSSGCFESAAHATSGTVKLYLKDNQKILSFEDFKTDDGPDLNIYLSASISPAGGINLGDLKGEQGSFYYTLDLNTKTDSINNVLVYCVSYAVLFGNSTLLK